MRNPFTIFVCIGNCFDFSTLFVITEIERLFLFEISEMVGLFFWRSIDLNRDELRSDCIVRLKLMNVIER